MKSLKKTVGTSNPDGFCIVLTFFHPLGVPSYAFGVKKRPSCNCLTSLLSLSKMLFRQAEGAVKTAPFMLSVTVDSDSLADILCGALAVFVDIASEALIA